MFELKHPIGSLLLVSIALFIGSCEKESLTDTVVSNDGMQARMAYTEKGFAEIEVTPVTKTNCYFSKWDKKIMTPISGRFEYYDTNGQWVASIDFGEGECDEWATKTWDTDVFPNYPSGEDKFSVFDYKKKK